MIAKLMTMMSKVMNIDDTGIVSEGRQLEPTPGWCERASAMLNSGVWEPGERLRLITEYEAAQKPAEPRTYTAAEAERLCRERPEEVEAVNGHGCSLRYNKLGFLEARNYPNSEWVEQTCLIPIEPFTLREVKPAEPQPEQPAAEELPEQLRTIAKNFAMSYYVDWKAAEFGDLFLTLLLAEVDRRIAAAVKYGAKVGSGTP